jgi:[ribosomal protein S5]-alanine N-acetyltransferase
MRMLKTERIMLKPVEAGVLDKLLILQWEKETMKLMNFKPLSTQDQAEWFKSLVVDKSKMFFSIYIRENISDYYKIAGLASLKIDRFNQNASFGIKLTSNAQGKGIGYETALILLHFGFSNMNLLKIHGDRVKENTGSIKLTKKLGMTEEGCLRKHQFINGEFRDLTLVGILKDEFYLTNLAELKRLGIIEPERSGK